MVVWDGALAGTIYPSSWRRFRVMREVQEELRGILTPSCDLQSILASIQDKSTIRMYL